jgi:hypothetical protein
VVNKFYVIISANVDKIFIFDKLRREYLKRDASLHIADGAPLRVFLPLPPPWEGVWGRWGAYFPLARSLVVRGIEKVTSLPKLGSSLI